MGICVAQKAVAPWCVRVCNLVDKVVRQIAYHQRLIARQSSQRRPPVFLLFFYLFEAALKMDA
jgi:hypothetical protein